MNAPAAERVSAALARARGFLATQGAAREARYVGALLGEVPREALRAEAAAEQADAGALGPLLAGDSPGPGAASTADALGWLIGLGFTEGPVVDEAVAWLARVQAADGGWSDTAARGEEARLALAASLCGWLVRCPSARLASLRRAATHLAAHWSRERAQGGSYRLIAGYLHAFTGVPADLEEADEALQWCGRELERGFRSGAFDAVEVGAVLVRCDARALPGARLGAAEIAAALRAAQAADGGFGAEPGRVRATCEAALALRHLG